MGDLVGKVIGGIRRGNPEIGDLSTEVVGVRTPSVETMILRRNHRR